MYCLRNFVSVLLPVVLAACTIHKPPPVVLPELPKVAPLQISQWDKLPDWKSIGLQASWQAFTKSCSGLVSKPGWQAVCARAAMLAQADDNTVRQFFEENFTPFQVVNPDGSLQGLITGYYEPRLWGSREKTERFRFPLYGVPDDLLTVELSEVYPQLKGMRLRGRLEGKRVVPYYNRAEIDVSKGVLQGRELFWVDDAVELFFLQVQGSGRIELPDGSLVKVGYADQNGHPYVSLGKKLVEAGELKLEEASMQGIKQWAARNPDKLSGMLEKNPSYVFFREMTNGANAPLGALGVPLTEGYSLAVDPRTIPLGAPVFIATTYPNSAVPLHRLMLAQDTGGAIKGAVRADFFWGFGEQAGAQAGGMKQQGLLWVLLPKEAMLPAAALVP